MVLNRFRIVVALIVISMAFTALGLGWSFSDHSKPFTISGFIVLMVLEAFGLLVYVNRVKEDISRFVNSLKNEDTSLLFKKRLNDPFFHTLHQDFNEIISDFRLVRKERELEHFLNSNIINQIKVGIIVFDTNGDVKVINDTFKNLAEISYSRKIANVKTLDAEFPFQLLSLQNGSEQQVNLNKNGIVKNLAVQTSRFKLDSSEIILVTLNDISREISRNEVETWQKLIKVMRHEILNSLSPVRIITSSLIEELEKNRTNDHEVVLNEQAISKLMLGLSTINKRAAGLVTFVDSYKDLTQVLKPNFKYFEIKSLVEALIALFNDQLDEKGINIMFQIDQPKTSIYADERLVEQLLINLIKNAIEALEGIEKPEIKIKVTESLENIYISINDNGVGIPDENIQDIFTPFFSTKENGTGVGLSLSRQIMQLHDGSIYVTSEVKRGSTFELAFCIK